MSEVENDAGQERNNPEHGRHESGDTCLTVTSRRATGGEASNETTRDEVDSRAQETASGVTYHCETHPEEFVGTREARPPG